MKSKVVLAVALALLLAFAVGVHAFATPSDPIRPEVKCSLEILPGNYQGAEDPEITISFYRVGDVAADGTYTPVDAFAGLPLDEPLTDMTPEKYAATLQKAEELAKGQEPLMQVVSADKSVMLTDLETGVYLAVSSSFDQGPYTYRGISTLFSLPTVGYEHQDSQEEIWYYAAKLAIKIERIQRYGRLHITKDLESYNPVAGDGVFVFSVKAEKDGNLVYSDVLTMRFSQAGSETITIEDLPVGAEVTVTEVYSGAGYTLVSEPEVKVVIRPLDDPEGDVSVRFLNRSDNTITQGGGVVNNFANDNGVWNWTTQDDNLT